jgi:hypothetical protein
MIMTNLPFANICHVLHVTPSWLIRNIAAKFDELNLKPSQSNLETIITAVATAVIRRPDGWVDTSPIYKSIHGTALPVTINTLSQWHVFGPEFKNRPIFIEATPPSPSKDGKISTPVSTETDYTDYTLDTLHQGSFKNFTSQQTDRIVIGIVLHDLTKGFTKFGGVKRTSAAKRLEEACAPPAPSRCNSPRIKNGQRWPFLPS